MPLKLHFLNVSHGDCTFIELPSGRLMMIDVNNSKSLPGNDASALAEAKSLSLSSFRYSSINLSGQSWEDYYESLLVDPYEYYSNHFAGRSIFRYVQTHPDMDHMSGLFRFFFQQGVVIENFWDVSHGKDFKEADFDRSPFDWADWVAYDCLRNGFTQHAGERRNHKVLHNLQGERGQYWDDDDIEVLSPTQDLIDECNRKGDYNDCSYVLRISYGGRSVLLPGDAESPAWDAIVDEPSLSLDCDILKASHHGRDSGYDVVAFTLMDPQYVICSVGKKPDTDASSKYSTRSSVLSTRFHGTIVATIWSDGDIWLEDSSGNFI